MQELKLVTKFPPGNNSYQGAKLKLIINSNQLNKSLIKSGGGTGPMKPSNQRKHGAKSCRSIPNR